MKAAVRTLNPGYFALVMATGIVSIGMSYSGVDLVSMSLLWIAGAAYVVLVILTGWRLFAFRAELIGDFTDPSRSFGFLTFVAASNVLGTRLVIAGHHEPALVLLIVGWLCWVVLGYLIPWTAVLGRAHRPVLPNANGTWFIWVVASQSVAVLAAALQPATSWLTTELALLAVFSWSVGVFLYVAAGIFVAAWLLLYELRPEDLTQPYWVAMGATAITVVAASRIGQMADTLILEAAGNLVANAAVVIWAFGSWLIPVLLAAGWWRHVVHRIPVRYDPTWWSVVFPLGMYGAASHFLGEADNLSAITTIGAVASWVALAAWALTFVAMLIHLALRPRPRSSVQRA